MKDLKLKITGKQASVLLAALLQYDIMWIQDLRMRLMVQACMAKLLTRLQSIDANSTKKHSIKLSPAQAAAFDLCFSFPLIATAGNTQSVEEMYAKEVIRSILADIHQYLTNLSTVIN